MQLQVNLTPITANNASFDQDNIMQPFQEPSENSSLPFLSLDDNVIEFGNKQTIVYGMFDSNQSTFVGGYNFSLFLISGNLVSENNFNRTDPSVQSLINGTTVNFRESLDINSLGDKIVNALSPGNYSVYLQINSTLRGLLNTTEIFSVKAFPDPTLKVEFENLQTKQIESRIELSINQTTTIRLILTNIGSVNAFNISVGVSSQVEPIGLFNTSVPFELTLLPSLESSSFNFSIKPNTFGQGIITFGIQFNDGFGTNKLSSVPFTVDIVPDVTGEIVIDLDPTQAVYLDPNDPLHNKILVNVRYQSLVPLESISIQFSLVSAEMAFVQDTIKLLTNKTSYVFTVLNVVVGQVEIRLQISYIDETGRLFLTEDLDISRFTIVEELMTGTVSKDSSLSFTEILPQIALSLYLVSFAILVLLYFRKDLRKKIFTKYLGLKLLPDIEFASKSVVIDGSNVAWEDTNADNKPKLENIFLAIDILKEYGFEDITVVADAALRYQIKEKTALDLASKEGKIKVLPARVDADGFILRYSAKSGSLILTNDLFKEYLEEYPWIEERRIPYSILDNELYLHPTFSKTLSK